ncbi:hypothetical protein SAMN05443582_108133 [Phyllobacterium sp. OV277]|nr:hypothetical protein SAMN05443582_108133 [Phyllobacterium sp. OV277]
MAQRINYERSPELLIKFEDARLGKIGFQDWLHQTQHTEPA